MDLSFSNYAPSGYVSVPRWANDDDGTRLLHEGRLQPAGVSAAAGSRARRLMKYSATARLRTQDAPISRPLVSSVTGPTRRVQGMVTTTMVPCAMPIA